MIRGPMIGGVLISNTIEHMELHLIVKNAGSMTLCMTNAGLPIALLAVKISCFLTWEV